MSKTRGPGAIGDRAVSGAARDLSKVTQNSYSYLNFCRHYLSSLAIFLLFCAESFGVG